MPRPDPLRDDVEQFIAQGARPDELHDLLRRCVADGSLSALDLVRRLYEDDYGGFTMSLELKAPAASALLAWEDQGLQCLTEAAIRNPTWKNMTIALQLLAYIAARMGLPILGALRGSDLGTIISGKANSSTMVKVARARLVELILALPEEDDVAGRIGFAIAQAPSPVARELFIAVSRRWLAISTPVLDEFNELIQSEPSNEPIFQDFLSRHPQLIDPLAVRIWPEPDLFGFKAPDFVVQRADGTYLVVEIECPAKGMVTKGGHLTAAVTHAEKQATDYRRYLVQKFAEFEKHFPDFHEPDCLVVIGLERALSLPQRQALHDANQARHHLRIVGFDWLLERAKKIGANFTQPEVEVSRLRVT